MLKDGQSLEADIIVFATGYKSLSTGVARYFGDEIAARVGEVWGYGPDGEIRNVWKRTPQPGLWFIAGGFPQARMFSKLLALQIKACEERIIFNGLNDGAVPRRELSSQT